jgi:hypothetical protein
MSANKKMNGFLNPTNQKVRFQDYLYLGTISALASILLTGCAASQMDMLQKRGALPETEYRIAKEMADMASQYCIKYTGFQSQSKKDWQKQGAIEHERWMIKRFFTSPNSDWYKGVGIAGGMITDLYYNPKTKQFSCGFGWEKYANSASVRFVEWGQTENTLSGVRD